MTEQEYNLLYKICVFADTCSKKCKARTICDIINKKFCGNVWKSCWRPSSNPWNTLSTEKKEIIKGEL